MASQKAKSEVLVVGAGFMGQNYLRTLGELSVPGVSVVEPTPTDSAKKLFSELSLPYYRGLLDALKETSNSGFSKVIVAAPTTEHLNILETLGVMAKNRKNNEPVAVLCEKPLVHVSHASQMSKFLEKYNNMLNIRTGFVCNASPAYRDFLELLKNGNAYPISIAARWSKDRTGDNRPSNGWFNDEFPHPLAAVSTLCKDLGLSQPKVTRASASHDSYVGAAAGQGDPNREHGLVSSGTAYLESLRPDGGAIKIEISGSYKATEKKRTVEVKWRSGSINGPRHHTSVAFDLPDGTDEFSDRCDGAANSFTATRFNKLQIMLKSFLSGRPSSALISGREALLMVYQQSQIGSLIARPQLGQKKT
jgi:predicted dehydrogenase